MTNTTNTTDADLNNLHRMLTKAHVTLMRNVNTRFFSECAVIGKSEIVVDGSIPTAATDGINKFYGAQYMSKLPFKQVVGVVLHELMHVGGKHMFLYPNLMKLDRDIANAAKDYVINQDIHDLPGYGDWIELPEGHLFNKKFNGWSITEVFYFLYKGVDKNGAPNEREEKREPQPEPQPGDEEDGENTGVDQERDDGNASNEDDEKDDKDDEQDGDGGDGGEQESDEPSDKQGKGKLKEVTVGGQVYKIETHDKHDEPNGLTEEELQEKVDEVDQAMKEAAAMAGVMGMNVPQTIRQAIAPEIDWREELTQFMTATCSKGRGEPTWRRIDMRREMDDIFSPAQEIETMGDIGIFIDTSGSTLGPILDKFCETVETVAKATSPDKIRVLFWDTEVRAEQVFSNNYDNLRQRLFPMGGGGTRVGCLPPYVTRQGYKFDCVIVITDGWVEDQFDWDINAPTLWVVTERDNFTPPKGRVVKAKE